MRIKRQTISGHFLDLGKQAKVTSDDPVFRRIYCKFCPVGHVFYGEFVICERSSIKQSFHCLSHQYWSESPMQ